jgi:hypothetical protein
VSNSKSTLRNEACGSGLCLSHCTNGRRAASNGAIRRKRGTALRLQRWNCDEAHTITHGSDRLVVLRTCSASQVQPQPMAVPQPRAMLCARSWLANVQVVAASRGAATVECVQRQEAVVESAPGVCPASASSGHAGTTRRATRDVFQDRGRRPRPPRDVQRWCRDRAGAGAGGGCPVGAIHSSCVAGRLGARMRDLQAASTRVPKGQAAHFGRHSRAPVTSAPSDAGQSSPGASSAI